MMNQKEIAEIRFGIFSPEEILNMSLCEINNPKKEEEKDKNTVYDPRMGKTTEFCTTCNKSAAICHGHFGHITFTEPIVNPLFIKRVVEILNCICLDCCKVLLTKESSRLLGFTKYKGLERFKRIHNKLKKIDKCTNNECKINKVLKCKISTDKLASSEILKVYDENKIKKEMDFPTVEVLNVLNKMTDDDVALLGFDPSLVHPKNMIIQVLPVLPPADRPYVRSEDNICDDDLTNQYVEIIKQNNKLKTADSQKRPHFLNLLRFRLSTTYNNNQQKCKHTTNNGRAVKGIKERLAGKDGQLRANMMGKRAVVPETPILLYSDGRTKKAKDIVIGDVVIGDDGSPRTVIDTVKGFSELYRVKQSYGDDYTISSEHILTLKYCGHCKIYWRPNHGENGGYFMFWYDRELKRGRSKKLSVIMYKRNKEECYEQMVKFRDSINTDPYIDIHVKDYLKMTPSTRRLMLGIKLKVPVKWPEKKVPIDPRILGMWLGDGSKNRACFTNIDKPLIDYFREWTVKRGGKLVSWNDDLHYGITCCRFLDLLRDNKLYNNKHIPEVYIINSEKVRLELLAGLIDTDGSVEQEGTTIRISQCKEHKAIIDGAYRIAKSLGFRATIGSKKTSWKHKGESKRGNALTLTISGDGIEKIPVLLPYKACKNPKNSDKTSCKIQITKIECGEFCGFEVDKNNRFLLGDYTITHNCNQSGRTVIGPDPTLRLGELAVPPKMANILTVPVKVTEYNKQELLDLINWVPDMKTWDPNDGLPSNFKATFIDIPRNGIIHRRVNLDSFRRGVTLKKGTFIERKVNGKTLRIEVKTRRELLLKNDKLLDKDGKLIKTTRDDGTTKIFKHSLRKYEEKDLLVGSIVHRHLKDGDYVLLNRQPTLHTGSMMAMKVVVRKGKTLRFNLAITKSFNADFDKPVASCSCHEHLCRKQEA